MAISDYPAKTEMDDSDLLIISREGEVYGVPFGVVRETIAPEEGA